MGVLVIIGTVKGGFVLRASGDRSEWTLDGPFFTGWKVTASTRLPSGRYLVATASDVYGPALHVSDDLASWRQIEEGPAWSAELARKLNQIWTLTGAGDRVYCGVDEAGLFESADGGETWASVAGLNEHHTRSSWFPGAGGLCAHVVLADPRAPERLWCGISAVGVFRSEDGGATWTPRNEGIPPVIEDKVHKDIGRCVHGLAADPDDANRLWRREHNGMFRSSDGGDSWERIENGLASWFGFPIAIDRRTKTIYTVPLESDERRMPVGGCLRVARSRDEGESWESVGEGLPSEHCYVNVLRGALDVDHGDPCAVFLGTTAGTLHVSTDEGAHWRQMPWVLPRILSVRAYADD